MSRALLLTLGLAGCLVNPGLRDDRISELTACDDKADGTLWFADADADGFGDPDQAVRACDPPDGHVADDGDCNDADGGISPAARERCDEIDNDCDGLIDDPGATDATTWYPDRDADGYGDMADSYVSCHGPPEVDWVVQGGDCDDTDPQLNPGIAEICNGLDDDCDGTPDSPAPPEATTWYDDGDGDGYGDPGAPTLSCEPPPGTVADSADCNDNDPLIHPGGVDLTLQDRDCDGLNADLGDADAELAGTLGQLTGTAISGVGDINGNGAADFLVGAPGTDALYDAGTAWLVLGNRVTGNADLAAIGEGFGGEGVADRAGTSVGGGGDFDGDGLPDAVIGSPGQFTDRGSVHLLLGDSQISSASILSLTELRGDLAGNLAGNAVALGGDLTGDTFADLLAGAPEESSGGLAAGAVYLVAGTTASVEGFLVDHGRFTGAAGDRAGSSVAWLTDFDGDGIGDLAVGGPTSSSAAVEGGRVWVLPGDPALTNGGDLDAEARRIFEGGGDQDRAGSSVADAGDVNGDGFSDLLVGAPDVAGEGHAYLILGQGGGAPTTGLAASDVVFTGLAGELAGQSVAGAGDVNADGFADYLVGAPAAGGADWGAAYLQLGEAIPGAALDPTTISVVIEGELSGDLAGTSVAGPGDLDGDGFDDVVIGAGGHDHVGQTDSGAVYVLFGLAL